MVRLDGGLHRYIRSPRTGGLDYKQWSRTLDGWHRPQPSGWYRRLSSQQPIRSFAADKPGSGRRHRCPVYGQPGFPRYRAGFLPRGAEASFGKHDPRPGSGYGPNIPPHGLLHDWGLSPEYGVPISLSCCPSCHRLGSAQPKLVFARAVGCSG